MTTSKNKSLSLKMTGILFMVLFNLTNMFSQNTPGNCKEDLKTTAGSYSLYEAQRFPTIECPAIKELTQMDESEAFDYDVIFTCQINRQNEKILALNTPKTNKKAQNKIFTLVFNS